MNAQTILDDGCWGLPHLYDGRAETQKPPLYYWLVAANAWLGGAHVNAWAVRIPAAVAALACVVVLVVGWGAYRRRPAVGFMAGAILASAVHFTWLARIGRIDMPLSLTTAIACMCFYLAGQGRGGRGALLAAYLALAAGLLLKGPIAVLLPAVVILAHLAVEGRLQLRRLGPTLRSLGLTWGVPMVLMLTVPWYVWAHCATDGEFTQTFFWHHNFGRGLGGTGLRVNPWWFYVPFFLGDFFPWSILLLAAGVWCLRHSLLRRDRDARFGLTWLLAVFVVLSCARFKRSDYLLPAYPGAALFLACAVRRWGRRRWLAGAPLVATVAGAAAIGWLVRVEHYLPAQEPYRDYTAFAAEVRRCAPRPRPTILFRTEAHPLAFHLGRPLDVLVKWEELRERLSRPGSHYIVMPPKVAQQCAANLPGARLTALLRNTDLAGGDHEHPLVLLTSGPAPNE